ncbi:YkuS family protein [Selenihalanaerobacter shriftii]|uniref:Uncharacterized protein family (UPF0180) n=1 Tax=Selenihalanaerobacter shriftii TaxID=142842 RepID=A0A1T4LX52_9FIRM|nr:YkuS family protein [Selenihalanaerobacter shriftii]SJZ59206.1 Uncharacterised protein family (UPF0180) [Selenihalanaerobacter shriftii]
MKRRIAIEEGLTNVSQELQGSNYEIVNLDSNNLQSVDAVIVSGEDNNMMNMSDIKTKAQVINAHGLSATQVRDEIKNRLV